VFGTCESAGFDFALTSYNYLPRVLALEISAYCIELSELKT
jgi:hypothetical protein